MGRGGRKRLYGGIGGWISGDSIFYTTNHFGSITYPFHGGNVEAEWSGGKTWDLES